MVRTAQEVELDQILRIGAVETELSVIETPGVALNKKTATIDRHSPPELSRNCLSRSTTARETSPGWHC